jgi:hypothetical protein
MFIIPKSEYANLTFSVVSVANSDVRLIVGSSNSATNVYVTVDAASGASANTIAYIASIAQDLDTISKDINTFKQLGNVGGTGIRTTSPFGWIGSASLYKLYVEEGLASSNTYVTNAAAQSQAIDRLKLFKQSILDNFVDEDGWTNDTTLGS